jgi:hypothetical protein
MIAINPTDIVSVLCCLLFVAAAAGGGIWAANRSKGRRQGPGPGPGGVA